MNTTSNVDTIRDSITHALEIDAPLVIDYNGGDCIFTARSAELRDAWENFDMGSWFEIHTGLVALIAHAKDRATWKQLETLVNRRVRRGGNLDNTAALLADLLSNHTGDNLAAALVYNDFATEIRALRFTATW